MAPRLKRSGRKKPPPAPQNRWDSSVTYHDESGQVYSEVSCAGTSMTTDWIWKTLGSTQEYGRFRSQGPGCSSLHDMATRSCLCNSSDITAEALEEVPETVGVALWNRLVAAQLDSIHLFLAFTKTYPTMEYRRYHVISRPNLPLPIYLKSLTSPTYQWLTQLSLLHITIPRTALIQVSLVPNLSVLTIGPGVMATDIGVDDSLLKTWSRSASTGAAFSALRVLALRRQPHITPRAFSYLTIFPALSVFATEAVPGIERRDKPIALAHGWSYKSGLDLSVWLATGSRGASVVWDAMVQALFNLGGQPSRELAIAKTVEGIIALPTVHLALGGCPDVALIATVGEEKTRVWYRSAASERSNETQMLLPDWSSNGENIDPQGFAAASSAQTVPHKRAPDLREDSVAGKKAKPIVRPSKRQDLGDLLSGFGT